MTTCEHIRCETVHTVAGDTHTFLVGIDNPAGTKTCEVCRKLEAFDDLLAACNTAIDVIYGLCDQQAWPDDWWKNGRDKIESAIAKAEGS